MRTDGDKTPVALSISAGFRGVVTVTPLIYQYGEPVIPTRERQARATNCGALFTRFASRCRTVAYSVHTSRLVPLEHGTLFLLSKHVPRSDVV